MSLEFVRSFVRRLPAPIRLCFRAVHQAAYRMLAYVPFTEEYRRNQWVRSEYQAFTDCEHAYIFQSIAHFCHVNRPIEGYYFEFGCHGGNTMRMAWDHTRYLFNWTYVAFDSFEGLPEIFDIDKQEIWQKGKLKTSEEAFVKLVTRHGMPAHRLMTVKGFYDTSLNDELKKRLLPRKAAVIYVDCDLYASTVPVLDFIRDLLQVGTILVFDDWNCFYGDPNRGERRAFREFLERNPDLIFEDFVQTAMSKAFVFTGSIAQE